MSGKQTASLRHRSAALVVALVCLRIATAVGGEEWISHISPDGLFAVQRYGKDYGSEDAVLIALPSGAAVRPLGNWAGDLVWTSDSRRFAHTHEQGMKWTGTAIYERVGDRFDVVEVIERTASGVTSFLSTFLLDVVTSGDGSWRTGGTMARPLRIEFPGAWHHIVVRGNERRAIFRSDTDRRRLLELFGECREQFALQIHGYVLMANHVTAQVVLGGAVLLQKAQKLLWGRQAEGADGRAPATAARLWRGDEGGITPEAGTVGRVSGVVLGVSP